MYYVRVMLTLSDVVYITVITIITTTLASDLTPLNLVWEILAIIRSRGSY